MNRLWNLPERAPGRLILALGCVFALAYALALVWLAKPDGRIVIGDAMHEYVQLRSAVFDRDLRFTNEYLRLYGLTPETVDSETEWIVDVNETGHIRNLMPVGPALLWAPAFLATCAGVWLANLAGWGYPLDGYGRLFQASAGMSGLIAAVAGAWLSYLAAAALFTRRSAIWATLAVWLASSAVYYTAISPTYSHAPSLFAVSLFSVYWLRSVHNPSVTRWLILGALTGVAALMRWQDAVLLCVPAIDALTRRRDFGWTGTALRLLAAGVGAFLAFTPQMIVWQRLYGHPLTIPQGSAFMQWTRPALGSVLLSDKHGLFSWTPVIALAVVGLIPLAKRAPRVGVAAAAFLVISWYVNASVADWWAGEAFGARRFVGCMPFFVLGLAAIFEQWRERPRLVVWCTALFVALTFLLLVQYQAFMHGARDLAPYPSGFYGLWLARFRVPFALLSRVVGQG